MLLIVFGHCSYHGIYGNTNVTVSMVTATVFSVDAFAFISGWYSVRFKLKKFIGMLGLGAFASLVLYILSSLVMGEGIFRFSLGWFGNAYLGLMVLAPLINCGIDEFYRTGRKMLYVIWFVYLALMTCCILPLRTIGLEIVPPGWGGHTANTVLFMYFTGRVLSKTIGENKLGIARLLCSFVLLELVLFGWSAVSRILRTGGGTGALLQLRMWDYCSPVVIALACVVFLLFLELRFPRWLCEICAYIAPSMFSVYLLHEGSNSETAMFLPRKLERLIAMEDSGMVEVGISVLITTFVVFFVCLSIDLIRRWGLAMLKRIVSHAKTSFMGYSRVSCP